MENNLFRIIRIEKSDIVSSLIGNPKTLHNFSYVLMNVSLGDCIQFLLHYDTLENCKMYFFRIVSMNEKKRVSYNVRLYSLPCIFSDNEEKKYNILEFNICNDE